MTGAALLDLATWIPILDGDADACAMFERHYSAAKSLKLRRSRGTRLFVGPGFKLVLATPCRRALFVWRKFKSADSQTGIGCAVFRNEGAGLSSELIRAADDIADQRWPGERHFTYVNPRAVRSPNPGFCFRAAGWNFVRGADGKPATTKARKLLILERAPHLPAPERLAA